MNRTDLLALAAADAFGAVGRSAGVNAHGAALGAGAAAGADVAVEALAHQADPLKQGIERSQRAEVFAEGPVDDGRGCDAEQQDRHFPAEQRTESRPQGVV